MIDVAEIRMRGAGEVIELVAEDPVAPSARDGVQRQLSERDEPDRFG